MNINRRFPRHPHLQTLCALAILGLGFWLLIGGTWLAVLGGARFYLLAGVAMTAAAGLLLAGHKRGGVGLYMATLGTMVIWAVTEAGADVPGLWSRLWLPVALGVVLSVAWWWSARR